MDLMAMGKKLLGDKLGEGAGGLMGGLSKLTGGGEGSLDLGELIGKLQSGGLGEQVSSWLGDGENAEVSTEQLKGALDSTQLSEMASSMGVDEDTALGSLKDALPGILDKASSGGSLLDNFSGATNALEMAKGLFK